MGLLHSLRELIARPVRRSTCSSAASSTTVPRSCPSPKILPEPVKAVETNYRYRYGNRKTGKKNDVFLWGDGGWIVSHRSKAAKAIRSAVGRILDNHGNRGVTPVYKERNVYNVYLRRKRPQETRRMAQGQPADMCPAAEAPPQAAAPGGRRRGLRP